MRITTGIYKGRKISMAKGIRPTQNITRKAVFDILGDVQGLFFLELFAGSGAVGIEALSRGAKGVFFVESNFTVIGVLKENLAYINPAQYAIFHEDAQFSIKRLFKEGRKFDIVFLDPPYDAGLLKKTLQTIVAYDILTPAGLVIAQHSKKESLPENLGVLSLLRQKSYGSTFLSIFLKKGLIDE